ncbi:MAG: diaminopimelate epimerase, partial [Planctomycetota bacterium]
EDRPWRVRVPFGGREWDGAVLSVGNPHLIVRIEDDPATLPLASIGPPLESAECFPDRANVSLVQQTAESALAMQTYERGTGVTLSCGSAACAAVVAFTDADLLPHNREIDVRTPGGNLGVRWSSSGALWLSGPAHEVFTGRAPLPA